MLDSWGCQWVVWTCLFLISLAFVAAFSRGAWVGLFSGFLIVAGGPWNNSFKINIRVKEEGLFIVFIGILMICVFKVGPLRNKVWDSNGRAEYWKVAGRMISRHPFLGTGPGNYKEEFPEYLTPEQLPNYLHPAHPFWTNLHSIYIQILVEYGIIGFLLWIAALAYLLKPSFQSSVQEPVSPANAWQPYLLIGIAAFLIHNLVDILFVSSLDLLVVSFAVLGQPAAITLPTNTP